MRNHFLHLFTYEQWANDRLITALSVLPDVPARTRQLVPHLFAAHQFMDKRLHGEQIRRFDFWPARSFEECMALNEMFAQKWARYLAELPEPLPEQSISFTGLDGQPRTLRIVDILTHLWSHSVHHRAQIVTDARASGLEPVPDYIRYCTMYPHTDR